MTWALLRYVIPWRLPLLISLALVAPTFAMVTLITDTGPIVLLLVAPVLLVALLLRHPSSRSTPFEAGLPISTRQLFVARMVVRMMLVWIPCAAIITVALAFGHPTSALLILGVAGIATLIVLVALCIRPAEVTLAGVVVAIDAAAVALLGGLVWYLLPLEVAFALLILAIMGTGARAWSTIPASYESAPVQMDHELEAVGSSSSPRPVWWPLLRSGLSWWGVVLLILCVGQGITGRGANMLHLASFFPLTLWILRRQMTWMEGLPVSRRAILLTLLLGSAAPVIGGTAIGYGLRRLNPLGLTEPCSYRGANVQRRGVNFYRTKASKVCVPLQYWARAPRGQAPVIQSPTGETAVPPTLLLPGVVVYNPYFVSDSNSDGFMNWQFARATSLIYGHPVPRDEAQWRERPPGMPVDESPRMFLLNSAALTIMLLGILLVINLREWHRLHRPSARWLRASLTAVIGVLYVVTISIDLWYTFKANTTLIWPAMQVGMMRLSAVLPQNLWAVGVIATLAVVAMYLIVERQSRATEAVTPVAAGRISGVGFPRDRHVPAG